MTDAEVNQHRLDAWKQAAELVAPIIELHGIEATKMSAPVLTNAAQYTKVEQHVDHILTVANWLLGLGR